MKFKGTSKGQTLMSTLLCDATQDPASILRELWMVLEQRTPDQLEWFPIVQLHNTGRSWDAPGAATRRQPPNGRV